MRGFVGGTLLIGALICIIGGIAFPPLLIPGIIFTIIGPILMRIFNGRESVSKFTVFGPMDKAIFQWILLVIAFLGISFGVGYFLKSPAASFITMIILIIIISILNSRKNKVLQENPNKRNFHSLLEETTAVPGIEDDYVPYDGGLYIGQWQDGKRHGKGTFIWENGKEYVGEWKDDMRHGKGTIKFTNGKKVTCIWENDKMY